MFTFSNALSTKLLTIKIILNETDIFYADEDMKISFKFKAKNKLVGYGCPKSAEGGDKTFFKRGIHLTITNERTML